MCLSDSCLFDEVSNFRKRLLINQKLKIGDQKLTVELYGKDEIFDQNILTVIL